MDHVKMISLEQVREVLTMKKSIDIVEKVYEAHGNGHVLMPAKITLDTGESNDWPPYGGSYNAMPAYIGEDVDISGVKWVWGFNDNRAKGIPYIGGVIILNEARTGEVLAVMDGSYITDVRTGASAGVTARPAGRKRETSPTRSVRPNAAPTVRPRYTKAAPWMMGAMMKKVVGRWVRFEGRLLKRLAKISSRLPMRPS